MRVKVVKKFRDKHTREVHKVGAVITISKERYAEIEVAGKYVEPVDNTEDVAEASIGEMTVAELREYAAEHNIELDGARNKAAIVEAIRTSEE